MIFPKTAATALIKESILDLRGDLDEIDYLLSDSANRLKQFIRDISKNKKNISPPTSQEVLKAASDHLTGIAQQKQLVAWGKRNIWKKKATIELINELETLKSTAYEFIRTHQALIGALITSTDWQSPSYAHSLHSQAGRQTGTIYATINDYKRDQHWDAYRYEQMFLKQYIDAIIKFPIQVATTSSGMAALTTILDFLLLEKKVTGPVLMGASTYFQSRLLSEPMFNPNVITYDETDTKEILRLVQIHNPSVICIDSLTNSSGVLIPNLKEIIAHLVKHATHELYLVIDNTGLSIDFQPIRLLIGKRSKLRIIVFESLMKYHQFGMDRVTGGIIYGLGGNDMGKLFNFRRHAGTNIPDSLATSLPTPNREYLTKRLGRHQRNAHLVALRLQQWIDAHPKSPFERIVYPKLTNHPSHEWAQSSTFTGAYFTVQFKKFYQTIPTYKRFLSMAINIARSRNVSLIAGSSFGMNQTRIYLTALHSKPSMPFVRISLGTESKIAIEALVNSFIEVFSSF